MSDASPREVLDRINRAWIEGRPGEIEPLVHPDVLIEVPSMGVRAAGRERLVASFVEFYETATIVSFEQSDQQEDVIGDTAVTGYRFDMVYERQGVRHRSTGRDLWVFSRATGEWVAVWRCMLDPTDEEVTG